MGALQVTAHHEHLSSAHHEHLPSTHHKSSRHSPPPSASPTSSISITHLLHHHHSPPPSASPTSSISITHLLHQHHSPPPSASPTSSISITHLLHQHYPPPPSASPSLSSSLSPPIAIATISVMTGLYYTIIIFFHYTTTLLITHLFLTTPSKSLHITSPSSLHRSPPPLLSIPPSSFNHQHPLTGRSTTQGWLSSLRTTSAKTGGAKLLSRTPSSSSDCRSSSVQLPSFCWQAL